MSNYIPTVTVIIPTYQDWDQLQICLQALENQSYPRPFYDIIIINNDPSCPPPLNINLIGNFIIVNESMLGSYAARNRGVLSANGDILAFLDSDCIPASSWLQEAVSIFIDKKDVSLIAGNIEVTYSDSYLTPAECYEKAYAFRQQQNAANGVSVTANLLVRREVFDEIGLFSESLMSGGDFEWTRRATYLGKRIIFGKCCSVQHPARRSIKALVLKARRVSTGSMTIYHESKLYGTLRRVLSNFLIDFFELFSRSDMTLRERSWALTILILLKTIKLHQRLLLKCQVFYKRYK